jgi:hypothetical protein
VGEDVASTGLHAVDHLVPRINESNTPPYLLEEYSRSGFDRTTTILLIPQAPISITC